MVRGQNLMSGLAGRLALMTGAASGIGRTTAKLFAAEGARVGILDRNGPEARRRAEGIRAGGYEAQAWEVDLAVGAATERTIGETAASGHW
jgi:3-oxoacyl-[acyl-carrier protein] reductase